MSQPASDDNAAAELTAWWRHVELCHPFHETCGAFTFRPSGAETINVDWNDWLHGVFVPVIAPALARLLSAVCSQDLKAVVAADTSLGAALSSDAARSSLAAGRRALAEWTPPRGAKLLESLRTLAGRDESIGHIATVFAVRGNIFHLPGVQLSGAYLLAECVAGAESVGVSLPAAQAADLVRDAVGAMRCGAVLELAAV